MTPEQSGRTEVNVITGLEGDWRALCFPTNDGRQCPFVRLDGQLAKRFRGLSLIATDLKEVADGLRQLIQLVEANADPALMRRIFLASLVTYGKAFAEAKGRGTRLSRDSDLAGASDQNLSDHDDMLAVRNEHVAHGGVTQLEQAVAYAVLEPERLGGVQQVTYLHAQINVQSIEVLHRWLQVVQIVRASAEKKLAKSKEALLTEQRNRPLEELYRLAEEQAKEDE